MSLFKGRTYRPREIKKWSKLLYREFNKEMIQSNLKSPKDKVTVLMKKDKCTRTF